MLCPLFLAQGNPFLAAWCDTDFIGKAIFVGLISLSLISWTILFHKWWISSRVRQESFLFKRSFLEQKAHPLDVSFQRNTHPETPNAFHLIYDVLRTRALELIDKNQKSKKNHEKSLYSSDMMFLETHAESTISTISKYLERNLYLLSTIVTLSPFLGLLGTVYGILVTFGGLSPDSGVGSNQQILGGLSLALTTTVIGLVNAIPALIGYNFLKNNISDFDHEMERFATDVLSSFTMQYRAVEV